MAPATWKNLWRNGRLCVQCGCGDEDLHCSLNVPIVCHSVDGRKTAPADMQNPV